MTEAPAARPLRVLLVDDSKFLIQSVSPLLRTLGVDVVGEVMTIEEVEPAVASLRPDAVLHDVRMSEEGTDEGIRSALAIREAHPEVGVLVFSTWVEPYLAQALFAHGSAHLGYLCKHRVADARALVQGLETVASGGTVVDPEVVSNLLTTTARAPSMLDPLTERERDVLALMAEGMSNVGIGARLFLSPRTVEAHIAQIFTKLPLDARDNTLNRRVLSVLAFLHDGETSLDGRPETLRD